MTTSYVAAQGQWWRLVTPVAMHASLLHLAVNCMSLHNLGPSLERLSGPPRFLAVYLASGVAGNVASFARSPAMGMGASGTARYFLCERV